MMVFYFYSFSENKISGSGIALIFTYNTYKGRWFPRNNILFNTFFIYLLNDDPKTKKLKFPKVIQITWNSHKLLEWELTGNNGNQYRLILSKTLNF